MSNTVKIQPIEPKERPILFSTEMVQAILEGRKTQTRRIKGLKSFNVQPHFWSRDGDPRKEICRMWDESLEKDPNPLEVLFGFREPLGHLEYAKCPYGKVGDLLWVREAHVWVMLDHAHDLLEGQRNRNQYIYKASMHEDWMTYAKEKYGYKWKPSIHMPKSAARIWLKVKEVRVERLHEITEEAAIAEGAKHDRCFGLGKIGGSHREGFINLWMDINGEDSWTTNPWVWVVEFEVVSTTGRP